VPEEKIMRKMIQRINQFLVVPSFAIRMSIFLSFSTIACIIAVYSEMVLKSGAVYVYLFWFSIMIAGVWFQKSVVYIGAFYGFMHLALGYLRIGYISIGMIDRAILTLLFAFMVSYIIKVILVKQNVEINLEKRIEHLIDSSHEGIVVLDLDGKIIRFNNEAKEMTGWSYKEAVEQNFSGIFQLYDEKNKFISEKFVKEALTNDTNHNDSGNLILYNKNGEKRYIENNSYQIRDHVGAVIGGAIFLRDITKKKEQEERIIYLSNHDMLTGLYNRKFFEVKQKKLDTESNYPLSILVGDLNNVKKINNNYGRSMGDKAIRKVADILRKRCREKDVVTSWGGDDFVVMMPKTTLEEVGEIVDQLHSDFTKVKLECSPLSVSFGWDTIDTVSDSFIQVLGNAENHMYRSKIQNSSSVRGRTISIIMEVLFEKSPREREHSERVGYYCGEIARELGLGRQERDDLKTTGLLHDIGKIIIKDNVLEKEGRLTESEWEEMKQHPVIGYRILEGSSEIKDIAIAIKAHHERWDGKGYPNGLKGEEISFASRIIAVADSYDAMVSKRPYKKALSKEYAIKEILDNAGTQFDPTIAKAFVEMLLKESVNEAI
jgi:diguanylate cyclase (GGDEF)-like protein/PAS domain S-box-containing protein/putative nucleotidyltransferase with HDIG domain